MPFELFMLSLTNTIGFRFVVMVSSAIRRRLSLSTLFFCIIALAWACALCAGLPMRAPEASIELGLTSGDVLEASTQPSLFEFAWRLVCFGPAAILLTLVAISAVRSIANRDCV